MTATSRISGPSGLIRAVPYLLGFQPQKSLVLIGLADGHLNVTARMDLTDATGSHVRETLRAIQRGGTAQIAVVIFDDVLPSGVVPHTALAADVKVAAAELNLKVLDSLYVHDNRRYWSIQCSDRTCCPPEGRELPMDPTVFEAEATVRGTAPLGTREELSSLLAPANELVPDELVARLVAGFGDQHATVAKRAIFAAAQTDGPFDDEQLARFGAALQSLDVRDAAWLAMDEGDLTGRQLWLEMTRRLPAPYNAPAAFLFGWLAWRQGNGALALTAVDRVLEVDPEYSAAKLLLAALTQGISSRQLPKLRRPTTTKEASACSTPPR